LGTGGVSIFALQIAVGLGARVIVTSSSDDKLRVPSHRLCRETVNHRRGWSLPHCWAAPPYGKVCAEVIRGPECVKKECDYGTSPQ
jgi:hypothetical protein